MVNSSCKELLRSAFPWVFPRRYYLKRQIDLDHLRLNRAGPGNFIVPWIFRSALPQNAAMVRFAAAVREMAGRETPEFFEWRPVEESQPKFACVPGCDLNHKIALASPGQRPPPSQQQRLRGLGRLFPDRGSCYFKTCAGTSKCAVFIVPFRWNCTQTR